VAALVPPSGTERELLAGYLAHQRHLVRCAAHGLSDEQARQTSTASTLSVGGLVKHLAQVERNWMATVLQRPAKPMAEAAAAYMAAFRLGADETLAGVLDDYAVAAADTDAVIAAADLDQPVPVPRGVPWFPQNVEAWSVRWVVLHLIEETARHLGHADIIRESLDGAQAVPLMAAAEGWAETDWVKPWRPPVTAA
jgi:uncharacterized damage-inducible protein DinB